MNLDWVAAVAGARSARRTDRIQSLWGGYGEIVRVDLEGAPMSTVVVKSVTPPPCPEGDVSDARKRRSYDVERTFYGLFAPRCGPTCRVPRLIGARTADGSSLLVLEDLDAGGFGERQRIASHSVLAPCLAWLAAFHARFLGASPEGLWQTGTYWHLATRRDELTLIADPALRAIAPFLDQKLAGCAHQTLVHGDAKLANFCFDRAGSRVAAVDFQYVGAGPGIRDVAYLLTGEREEAHSLEDYFDALRRELTTREIDPAPVEAEWRALYPFACADFYRFLAGWAPSHYQQDPHARRVVRQMVDALR